MFRELGEVEYVAYALHDLGLAAHRQGDDERAGALLAESLTLLRQTGNWRPTGEILPSIGQLALDQGDYKRAAQAFREGLQLRREKGMRWVLATDLEGLASAEAGQGRVERAARLFGAAERLRDAIGAPIWPARHASYEKHVAMARSALGEERFAAAWQAGRAMTLEQAIACALDDDGPTECEREAF